MESWIRKGTWREKQRKLNRVRALVNNNVQYWFVVTNVGSEPKKLITGETGHGLHRSSPHYLCKNSVNLKLFDKKFTERKRKLAKRYMGGIITRSLVRVQRDCWRVMENFNKEQDSDTGRRWVWAKNQNSQDPGKEQGAPLEPIRREHRTCGGKNTKNIVATICGLKRQFFSI